MSDEGEEPKWYDSNAALREQVKGAVLEALHDRDVNRLAHLNMHRRPGSPPITDNDVTQALLHSVYLNRLSNKLDRKAWLLGASLIGILFTLMTLNSLQDILDFVRKKIGG